MKTKLFYVFLIVFIIGACTSQKNSKIEGAWKLVQYQTIIGDSVINEYPGKRVLDVTKIWSENHVAFAGTDNCDTIVEPDWYGVGTYKLEGNKYVETTSILFYKPWEGTTIKMKMEMKNDTLIIYYPVDDKGQMEKDCAWIEKYVRL
jgi:hypothetical protein